MSAFLLLDPLLVASLFASLLLSSSLPAFLLLTSHPSSSATLQNTRSVPTHSISATCSIFQLLWDVNPLWILIYCYRRAFLKFTLYPTITKIVITIVTSAKFCRRGIILDNVLPTLHALDPSDASEESLIETHGTRRPMIMSPHHDTR